MPETSDLGCLECGAGASRETDAGLPTPAGFLPRRAAPAWGQESRPRPSARGRRTVEQHGLGPSVAVAGPWNVLPVVLDLLSVGRADLRVMKHAGSRAGPVSGPCRSFCRAGTGGSWAVGAASLDSRGPALPRGPGSRRRTLQGACAGEVPCPGTAGGGGSPAGKAAGGTVVGVCWHLSSQLALLHCRGGGPILSSEPG